MHQRAKQLGLGSALAAALLWLPAAGAAEPQETAAAAKIEGQVTWTKDILPIVQENCQVCHRPSGANLSGMVAPFSLVTYREARPWAKSMAKKVAEKSMPPWFASKNQTGDFELERSLTGLEIATIVRWAETNARRGNPADAPEPVDFASAEGWLMGEPDLVLELPEPYWVEDDVVDIQPSFSIVLSEEQLPEDRWVQWVEFHPDSKIVHHAGMSSQPLDENGKPVADPLSGGKLIGTAQGDGPDVWPLGYGKLIRKGSRIRMGLHYNKEAGPGTGVWDRSKFAIKWKDEDEAVEHVVRATSMSSRGWEIPPYHPNWPVGNAKTFDEDTYIVNMMPHMHWRGKAARYVAVYPDGSREVLLDVPNYDFRWQMTYTFKEPKLLPAGSRLETTMWFDNSADNEFVSDPERPIGFGGMTADEMNNAWTEYANATPIQDILDHDFGAADESTVLDTTLDVD